MLCCMGKNRVLVVGDLHQPFTRPEYLDFCQAKQEEMRCNRVVLIGDVVDIHAVSRHLPNPNGHSPGEELDLAVECLRPWVKAFPTAMVCVGNHDSRYRTAARESRIPDRVLRPYRQIFETGRWRWDLSWQIDGVLYKHGTGYSSRGAALKAAIMARQPVVMGHIHTDAGVYYSASDRDLIFGLAVGCGFDAGTYAAEYQRDFKERPVIGCGAVLHGKEAHFLPADLGCRYQLKPYA